MPILDKFDVRAYSSFSGFMQLLLILDDTVYKEKKKKKAIKFNYKNEIVLPTK